MNLFGLVDGNMDVYAHDDFNAYYGGITNGAVFAKDSLYADTVIPGIFGLLDRYMNKGTDNWADPTNKPLGLPVFFPTVSTSFNIDEMQKGIWEND